MVLVMGVMSPTMGCADGGPNTGVGTVKIGRRGRKATAARNRGYLAKVLIHVMIRVRRHSVWTDEITGWVYVMVCVSSECGLAAP